MPELDSRDYSGRKCSEEPRPPASLMSRTELEAALSLAAQRAETIESKLEYANARIENLERAVTKLQREMKARWQNTTEHGE